MTRRSGAVSIACGVSIGLSALTLASVDSSALAQSADLVLCDRVAAANGNIYWIADRTPYAMNEIVSTIEQVLEQDFQITVKHKVKKLPGLASSVAYGLDKMTQGMGIYLQKIHVLSEMNKTIACTTAKAERELGYDPQIALREGMKRSIAWVLERGPLPPS